MFAPVLDLSGLSVILLLIFLEFSEKSPWERTDNTDKPLFSTLLSALPVNLEGKFFFIS